MLESAPFASHSSTLLQIYKIALISKKLTHKTAPKKVNKIIDIIFKTGRENFKANTCKLSSVSYEYESRTTNLIAFFLKKFFQKVEKIK